MAVQMADLKVHRSAEQSAQRKGGLSAYPLAYWTAVHSAEPTVMMLADQMVGQKGPKLAIQWGNLRGCWSVRYWVEQMGRLTAVLSAGPMARLLAALLDVD
jgi:hypothetical protein